MTDTTDTPETASGPLAAQLLSPATFEPFVEDCKTLIADEIRRKGLTIRTAFGVVQKVKPDILGRTVRELLPGFVQRLEPLYADFRAGEGERFEPYLLQRPQTVAEAVLAVADARAERIGSRTIRGAYDRARGRAQREIMAAMPRIAATVDRHVHARNARA